MGTSRMLLATLVCAVLQGVGRWQRDQGKTHAKTEYEMWGGVCAAQARAFQHCTLAHLHLHIHLHILTYTPKPGHLHSFDQHIHLNPNATPHPSPRPTLTPAPPPRPQAAGQRLLTGRC